MTRRQTIGREYMGPALRGGRGRSRLDAAFLVSLGILCNACSEREADEPVSQSPVASPAPAAGARPPGETDVLGNTPAPESPSAPDSAVPQPLSNGAETGRGADAPRTIVNSIGMRLALIPPGEFEMGTTEDDKPYSESYLRHHVRITKPFYLGVYEVTQAEYQHVRGTNPSCAAKGGQRAAGVSGQDTGRLPVEMVSWEDAIAFCRELSAQPEERQARRVYRLPTEAEWEYACRAGTTTPYCVGSVLTRQDACFGRDYLSVSEHPAAVGSYRPNAFGLYDMHGNVWEWCADWFGWDYYAQSPTDDPPGPGATSTRVYRGGAWAGPAWSCRSAHRKDGDPSERFDNLGFRVAVSPPGG